MKKIKFGKIDIYTTILCLASMIPGIAVYDKLPEKIATHFNINNEPDQFSSKAFAVFGMPLILMAIHILACLISNYDAREKNTGKIRVVVRFIVPVIGFCVETFMILYAMDSFKDIGTGVISMLAIIFIVLGNYMPKCRQNSVIGVRVSWTLNNEEVWDKTHRMSGFLWVICGIIMLPLAFLKLYIPIIVLFLIMMIVPLVYAQKLYSKLNSSK